MSIEPNKASIPKSTIPKLTILPFADDLYTDHDRGGKQFMLLHFRHDGAVLPRITDWIGSVMVDVTRVGLEIPEACQTTLTPRTQPVTEKTQWRCLIKVPVRLMGELGAGQQLLDAVRDHYRK